MEPTRPRTVVHSGVAPTIRARAALVRALSALNRWEDAYLGRRGPERSAAYKALMEAVYEAQRAMTEGDTAAARPTYVVSSTDPDGWAQAPQVDLAAGDHFAGMPGDQYAGMAHSDGCDGSCNGRCPAQLARQDGNR